MNSVARTRYRHWQVEIADTQAQLTLDVAGQSANTLSREVLAELEQILAELAPQYLRGLILRSAKPGGFIAGADVREFEKITDALQATELARNAQRVFAQLAALPFPSVALIHGYCLGGGLELALACTYRVAREDAATRLGLPEVRLGIHPGFAGTLRLPALIGDLPALDLMLSGRSVSAREARRWGLVDEVVPERHLLHAAQALLRRHAPRRQAPWHQRLAAWRPLRPWVARVLRTRLSKKAPPQHYPAPHRLLELWQHRATAEQEAQSLGELLVSPTGRNLTQLFLRGEARKRAARAVPHSIEWVHVIGAGTMGADIALWAAQRGFRVSLQDRHPEALARALKRAHEFCKKRQREPRAVQEVMDRLMPDLAGNGLKRADLVIEAIVEDLEAKQALFREIEQKIKPQALLATNTSSIPLEDLATALSDPSRLVGLHFFNPVAKMQLIEIVRGALTSEAALARARAFAVALDRLPLDVASRPGFLVNRVLM
ncbi:MAG: 3-hydroxyacyl-CoA dehydrogenase NAD-binding domain-containing protein, partial [Pseudomonadota bacterium]